MGNTALLTKTLDTKPSSVKINTLGINEVMDSALLLFRDESCDDRLYWFYQLV